MEAEYMDGPPQNSRWGIGTALTIVGLLLMALAFTLGGRLSEQSFAYQQTTIQEKMAVQDSRIATLEESVRGMKEGIARIETGVGNLSVYLMNHQSPSTPPARR